jgi:hypothetical protein
MAFLSLGEHSRIEWHVALYLGIAVALALRTNNSDIRHNLVAARHSKLSRSQASKIQCASCWQMSRPVFRDAWKAHLGTTLNYCPGLRLRQHLRGISRGSKKTPWRTCVQRHICAHIHLCYFETLEKATLAYPLPRRRTGNSRRSNLHLGPSLTPLSDDFFEMLDITALNRYWSHYCLTFRESRTHYLGAPSAPLLNFFFERLENMTLAQDLFYHLYFGRLEKHHISTPPLLPSTWCFGSISSTTLASRNAQSST